MWMLVLACAHPPGPAVGGASARTAGELTRPSGRSYVLRGADVLGEGVRDVVVVEGRIAGSAPDAEVVNLAGRYLVPAWIDSHVHLAYLPEAEALADGGVAAVVDLAAPRVDVASGPLTVFASGPMITAIGGYPTQSWGSGGYGRECADSAAAVAAVYELADAGARVIKLPVTDAPCLDDESLNAVVEAAHQRGLKVVSHALGADDADRAAAAGVDALAHTPTELLPPESVARWSGRAVITTLIAFGNSASARSNLAALSAAGATVLYGTDFGNTRALGIDGAELDAIASAGLDGTALIRAATSDPSQFWGFEEGVLSEGRPASLLVLDGDPRERPETLTEPVAVVLRGVWR